MTQITHGIRERAFDRCCSKRGSLFRGTKFRNRKGQAVAKTRGTRKTDRLVFPRRRPKTHRKLSPFSTTIVP